MQSIRLISILIAEDHNVVRQALCSLLKADGSFRIVGEARNGREAVILALANQPDVILMDISMPLLNGIEATRQILTSNPKARIVMLSAYDDAEYSAGIFRAGVFAFLHKDASPDILFEAIRKAADGVVSFSSSIIKRLHKENRRPKGRDGLFRVEFPSLTPRESEVLQLIAEGSSNKQCASELHVSIRTIDKHRQRVMGKLDIHGTAGLTRYAVATRVINVG